MDHRVESASYVSRLDHIDIGPTRWAGICFHALQPLRFCLESVRYEFLHLARLYGPVDTKALDLLVLQKASVDNSPTSSSLKKRKLRTSVALSTPATLEKVRMSGGVGGLGEGTNPLDSFFPFDPYLLRRSYAFIEPFYVHWSGPTVAAEKGNCGQDLCVGVSGDDREMSGTESFNIDDGDDSDKEEDTDDDTDDDSSENSSTASDSYLQTSAQQPIDLSSADGMSEGASFSSPNVNRGLPSLINHVAAWSETWKRPRAPSMGTGSW